MGMRVWLDEYKQLYEEAVKTGQTVNAPAPDKRGERLQVILLWTAGTIIGGFHLMQFMLYMMFRPEFNGKIGLGQWGFGKIWIRLKESQDCQFPVFMID